MCVLGDMWCEHRATRPRSAPSVDAAGRFVVTEWHVLTACWDVQIEETVPTPCLRPWSMCILAGLRTDGEAALSDNGDISGEVSASWAYSQSSHVR